MADNFFRFRASSFFKGAIRPQPKIQYDTLALLSVDSKLRENNNFYIVKGKKETDFIQFYDSQCFAISESVKKVFKEENVTGWDCFPIIIDGTSKLYYAFINASEAGVVTNRASVNNGETNRLKFEMSSWDGSDIFHLKDTLINVCTARVKEILEKKKFKNIDIYPL